MLPNLTFFSPQIIFKYPIQSVCEFSNPLKHFKRPKIQKNPFCSLPPFFLLLKYYPSLSTLITLYWIQLLKSKKYQNKIQLIINQFQFIHCWYSDCSDLQSNSKKICQKCSIWDSKKKKRVHIMKTKVNFDLNFGKNLYKFSILPQISYKSIYTTLIGC